MIAHAPERLVWNVEFRVEPPHGKWYTATCNEDGLGVGAETFSLLAKGIVKAMERWAHQKAVEGRWGFNVKAFVEEGHTVDVPFEMHWKEEDQ